MVTTDKLTFDELARLEPGLAILLKDAKAYKPVLGKCPISDWYLDFKPRLVKLVGWFATKNNSTLKSQTAYDLAYREVLSAMDRCPAGCRGCSK